MFSNSFVQDVIEKQIANVKSPEKPKYEVDKLRLYFCEDYTIQDKIIIHQPRIQDFIDLGETNIYSVIAPFTCNTTSYRVQLWDMGIDWNKISDFQLFTILVKTIQPEYAKIMFQCKCPKLNVNGTPVLNGKGTVVFENEYIDFQNFKLCTQTKEGKEEFFLYNSELNLKIDQQVYEEIFNYICNMFNTFPKRELCKNKTLKQDLINKDKLELANKELNNSGSHLLPMVSFALNHPGFKYKKNELRDVGIYEFMDSVQRLQIYESTKALIAGSYSGFADLSKVNKDEFNFMRDIKIDA